MNASSRISWHVWVALLALSSCGPRYVDSAPPRLKRVKIDLAPKRVEEPTVALLLTDFFTVDSSECQPTQTAWIQTLEDTLTKVSSTAPKIFTFDVSRACTHQRGRNVGALRLINSIEAFKKERPESVVRPLILYLNNLEGSLTEPLRKELLLLRDYFAAKLWVVAPESMAQALPGSVHIPWTYLGDDEPMKQFRTRAEDTFPLLSYGETGVFRSVFSSDHSPPLAFKICEWDERLQPSASWQRGATYAYESTRPPSGKNALAEKFAFDKNEFVETSLLVTAEGCFENCDRLHEDAATGKLAFWNTSTMCLSTPLDEVRSR